MTLLYVNEHTIVAAGHDCAPFVVTSNGSEWYVSQELERKPKAQNMNSL